MDRMTRCGANSYLLSIVSWFASHPTNHKSAIHHWTTPYIQQGWTYLETHLKILTKQIKQLNHDKSHISSNQQLEAEAIGALVGAALTDLCRDWGPSYNRTSYFHFLLSLEDVSPSLPLLPYKYIHCRFISKMCF